MPNYCYNKLEIKGSVKQLEKLNKLLTGKDTPSFSTIPRIDYALLFTTDYINNYFKAHPDEVEHANTICATYKIDLISLLQYIYKYIKSGKSEIFINISNLNDMDKTINDLCKLYFKDLKNTKEISVSNDDTLKIYNLLPDNPLSFYRKDFVENGILHNSDKDMPIEIDDWYKTRNYKTIGSKWYPELLSTYLDKDKKILSYCLNTAWGPCDTFARILTEIFDVVTRISYSEPNCCCLGYTIYVDGNEYDSYVVEDTANQLDYFYHEYVVLEDYEPSVSELIDHMNETLDDILYDFDDEMEQYDDYIFDAINDIPKFYKFLKEYIDDTHIQEEVKEDLLLELRNNKRKKIKIKKIK